MADPCLALREHWPTTRGSNGTWERRLRPDTARTATSSPCTPLTSTRWICPRTRLRPTSDSCCSRMRYHERSSTAFTRGSRERPKSCRIPCVRQSNFTRGGTAMAKILFVMTGASYWTLKDGHRHPTGYWAEEFVAPYRLFTQAGHQVTVATPGGVVPVVDTMSLRPSFAGGEQGALDEEATIEKADEMRHPVSLKDVRLDENE